MKIKRIFCTIALGTITALSVFAQGKSTPAAVTISGKINFDDSYLVVINDQRSQKSEEHPISKTGNFSWRSDLKSPGFVNLYFIPKSRDRQLALGFPVYVSAGSNVQLNLAYTNETYLTLLPGKVDGNNKALIEYSNFSFLKMRDMFRNQPASLDRVKSTILPYLETSDSYITKFGVTNETVKKYMEVWAMNNYMNGLFSLSASLRRNDRGAILPSDYFDFPKSPALVYNHEVAVLFNETAGNVNQYVNLVNKAEPGISDPFKRLELKFKSLDQMFTNKQLVDRVVAGDLEDFSRKFTFRANTNFDEELAKYKELTAYVKAESKRAELVKNFSNLKFTLKGAALPDVAFKDVNGKEVKLQSFAGKYIYIDLWASWCKPCIAEIPNLHKLEKEYQDKNVVFVSISLDADKTAWRKKMAELKLEGHQLELGDSGYDQLMNVSGIPHFLLYDPEGKLVMHKAPRPGTAEIRTALDRSNSSK